MKRRTVRYTVGWKITPEDESAIARITNFISHP
jgi:hypothetical protein